MGEPSSTIRSDFLRSGKSSVSPHLPPWQITQCEEAGASLGPRAGNRFPKQEPSTGTQIAAENGSEDTGFP